MSLEDRNDEVKEKLPLPPAGIAKAPESDADISLSRPSEMVQVETKDHS